MNMKCKCWFTHQLERHSYSQICILKVISNIPRNIPLGCETKERQIQFCLDPSKQNSTGWVTGWKHLPQPHRQPSYQSSGRLVNEYSEEHLSKPAIRPLVHIKLCSCLYYQARIFTSRFLWHFLVDNEQRWVEAEHEFGDLLWKMFTEAKPPGKFPMFL